MQPPPNTTSPRIRDERLDVIKAISIILVLFWHLQPIDVTAPRLTAFHISSLLKESLLSFYKEVTLVAVPSFFLVALYLYFSKLNENGPRYILTRLAHLLRIFVFWVLCQILVYYIIVIPKSLPFSEQIKTLAQSLSLWTVFLEGGPALPLVGGSVFYYLSSLFILTILATLFWLLAKINWLGITTGMAVVAGSLLYFEYCSVTGVYVSLLNIVTFALYIPIAFYFNSSRYRFSKPLLWFLFAGYVVFFIQDYYLRNQGLNPNAYPRPAIVFGAATLFYGVRNLKFPKMTKTLGFFSTFSLGIYAIHKYFQYLSIVALTPFFAMLEIPRKVPWGEFRIDAQAILVAVLVVTLSVVSVYLLDKTPLRKFIR